ncbi:MAG: universal stress protein [Planctomycetes bacterium]|nr:universal stress protein [Planctomycetota bacterium]
MKRFMKILVGVDLSWGDRLVAEELSAPNAGAVRQALWLAKQNSTSVCFFSSLDLSAKVQRLIAESSSDESTILDEAENQLAKLVTKAREEGVEAESHLSYGKSWVELIRHVLREGHDLVLVGTRHISAMQGYLLGSTGIKLLRKCPCAVWVTQPLEDQLFDSILVAHDLRPVGDLAMDLGCSMAQLQQAQLHVLHAAEYPELDYIFPADISAEKKDEYRREAEKHIRAQLANANLSQPAQLHLTTEPPVIAIMDCAEQHNIDLIIMGTVGRTGISGFITGNTAERLLPQISCSLLAVKPEGFRSPVTLDEEQD